MGIYREVASACAPCHLQGQGQERGGGGAYCSGQTPSEPWGGHPLNRGGRLLADSAGAEGGGAWAGLLI